MDFTKQRLCAWCGIACPVIFMIGFVLVAGFVPPPSPSDSAEQIGEYYRSDQDRIRAGMIISMFAAGLTGPFVAALTLQMARIERGVKALTITQFIMGALLVLEFILFLLFWEVAAFRADRSNEDIQLINDLGWVPFVGLSTTAVIQGFVVGAIILGDERETPLIPRWAAYVNILIAMCTIPGSSNSFFTTGPLAWNGLVTLYIPMTGFMLYFVVNTYVVLRAIRIEEGEVLAGTWEDQMADGKGDLSDVVRRLERLERERAAAAHV